MVDYKACLAEFIGTFFLCFCGIAAILSNHSGSGAGLVGIALAHGVAIAIAVSLFGGVSGGHFNPAVTGGMLATGRIKAPSAVAYIFSQCLASVAAAFLCTTIFQDLNPDAITEAKLGIPLPGADTDGGWLISSGTVLLAEFIMTFLLVTAVFGTMVDSRGAVVNIGGLAIGLTMTIDILAGGHITGASMNPARSFGPALVHGFFELHHLYWIGPLTGGIVAALVYQHLILDEKNAS